MFTRVTTFYLLIFSYFNLVIVFVIKYEQIIFSPFKKKYLFKRKQFTIMNSVSSLKRMKERRIWKYVHTPLIYFFLSFFRYFFRNRISKERFLSPVATLFRELHFCACLISTFSIDNSVLIPVFSHFFICNPSSHKKRREKKTRVPAFL